MKFKLYLAESLNKVLPYRIKKDTIDVFATEFKINDKVYVFIAERFEDDDENFMWDIVFYLASRKNTIIGMETEITGTGDQFTVFATVIDIFKQFIKEKNPETFVFSSEDKSRSRLYDRFAKEIEKRFGYKAEIMKMKSDSSKAYSFIKEHK